MRYPIQGRSISADSLSGMSGSGSKVDRTSFEIASLWFGSAMALFGGAGVAASVADGDLGIGFVVSAVFVAAGIGRVSASLWTTRRRRSG